MRTYYDSIALPIPPRASGFQIVVLAEKMGRIFSAQRRVNPSLLLERIRFEKDGKVVAGEFNITDTVLLIFAIRTRLDSLSYAIVRDGRTLRRESSHPVNPGIDTILLPLSELKEGDYELRLTAFGYDREEDILKFHLTVPFYFSDAKYNEAVDQLMYIATPEELSRMKKIRDPKKRRQAYEEFWKSRDPTPGTEENELKEEYLARIRYAEENFKMGDLGWRSDRGKIYIKYGPPDEIESHPFEAATRAYEIWYYYNRNLKFIFIDRYGFGRYELLYPEGSGI
ncbi:hypothetical protein DRP53_00360 [candidate division WOR-3 bacterium]|uniref:GWxTD domain-containing protein n=1 Tax=candidate division WOR-3 bacterium TaxID=2052148 RepID=A0A660SMQ6_UNCW3|nr:MAG: hypothetical protein DRP53_00360 [candidate division WOR-3 bacterium]